MKKPAKKPAKKTPAPKPAKPYLSHEKLGITFAEYGALFGLKGMLEAGVMKLAKDAPDGAAARGMHLFNMNVPMVKFGCGTVGCIGGHMALIMGKNPVDYVVRGVSALDRLFFPYRLEKYGLDVLWEEITPYEAAEAIDNFLRTGKPGWQKVLANHVSARNRWHGRKA